jgi:hypothetical protein
VNARWCNTPHLRLVALLVEYFEQIGPEIEGGARVEVRRVERARTGSAAAVGLRVLPVTTASGGRTCSIF